MTGGTLSWQVCQRTVAGSLELSVGHLVVGCRNGVVEESKVQLFDEEEMKILDLAELACVGREKI